MSRFISFSGKFCALLPLGAIVLLALATVAPASQPTPAWQPNPAQRAWITKNPFVRVSYDPAWAPFSHRDEAGAFIGLDADLLELLAGRTGLRFEPVHHPDWAAAYQAALAGEVSVLTSTAETPERAALFRFSRPYVAFPLVIITRDDEPSFDDLSVLVGRRIGVVREHAPNQSLKRDLPELIFIEYESMARCLHAVSAGEVDAALNLLVNSAYLIRQHGLSNLKVAGVAPYTFALRFAIRRDQPELASILNDAIASLSAAERRDLVAPYARLDTGAVVSWQTAIRWFISACVVAGLLIAAAGWHNYRLQRELDQRLRLQRELEKSHARLESLNREKSGLMRMAAHDLRNPLTGLLISIDLVRMDDPDTRRQGLDRMVLLVHQMLHMIRNLLDVEALEAGTRRLHTERIELAHALREALATFEPVAKRKSITLHYAEAEPGLAVQADRGAFRQICDNLLSNAVKYSPVHTAIRIASARTSSNCVRLSVRDEGPGIRADEQPRLFQRYTCLSARPTGGEISTGLGLSIVKELVENMRGRVWCESEPGRGATFLVELPAAEPAPAPDPTDREQR
jgi:signal transduction histidine kinase